MAARDIFKSSYHLLTKFNCFSSNTVVGAIRNRFVNPELWGSAKLYSSQAQKCLMEFFDDESNWNKKEIRVGRSWRKDELRIKSNEDLHKLWFVLLKERNMLLSMEEECKRNVDPFPSPERLYKVKESMVNLEDVVRERNKAYYLLETGTTGERPGKVAVNQLGMRFFYKTREHWLDKKQNMGWLINRKLWYRRKECDKFLSYFREKQFTEKRKAWVRDRNHIAGLIKRFPDIDLENLQEQYPTHNIDRIKNSRRADGHYSK